MTAMAAHHDRHHQQQQQQHHRHSFHGWALQCLRENRLGVFARPEDSPALGAALPRSCGVLFGLPDETAAATELEDFTPKYITLRTRTKPKRCKEADLVSQ